MTDGIEFSEIWAEYTDEHLGRRADLSVPDGFDRSEWDSVGYMPPERRSENEPYNWSAFYDFFCWLRENGYIE
jgi:hypothetical protein